MKRIMIVFLILAASAAGICFAGSSTGSNSSLLDDGNNAYNGNTNSTVNGNTP